MKAQNLNLSSYALSARDEPQLRREGNWLRVALIGLSVCILSISLVPLQEGSGAALAGH